MTASSQAGGDGSREREEAVWGGDFNAEEIVTSVAQTFASGAKLAATGMGVVPLKRRGDGGLEVNGQGLLNLVRVGRWVEGGVEGVLAETTDLGSFCCTCYTLY